MNSEQRRQVRESFDAHGFRRTDFTDDLTGVGDYAETWTHPDGTSIEITWAPRDHAPVARPDDTCPDCGHGTRDGRLACGPDCNRGADLVATRAGTPTDGRLR